MVTFTARAVNLFSGYAELHGNLEGTGIASALPYKVPAIMRYPIAPSIKNGVTIVEAVNSATFEVFDGLGFYFDSIPNAVPNAALIASQGFTHLSVEWYKYSLGFQVALGASSLRLPPTGQPDGRTPFDATWTIPAGDDAVGILRDASLWARTPVIADPMVLLPPSAVGIATNGVILAGYSPSGQQTREFYYSARNTGLGGPFPNALVFEGGLAIVAGAGIRTATAVVADNFASYSEATGATPVAQSNFINLQTEDDLQVLNGFLARPAAAVAHYKNWELAGFSHIAFGFIPLNPIQNPLSLREFINGALEALRAKIVSATALPADKAMDGSEAVRAFPLFAGDSPVGGTPWTLGTDPRTWNLALGPDGNALGGLRPVQLQTILSNGAEVGAPIAEYRGTSVITPGTTIGNPDAQFAANAVEIAQGYDPADPGAFPLAQAGFELFYMISGTWRRYSAEKLRALYSSNARYVGLIRGAAQDLLDNRYIITADRDRLIAEAVASGIGTR